MNQKPGRKGAQWEVSQKSNAILTLTRTHNLFKCPLKERFRINNIGCFWEAGEGRTFGVRASHWSPAKLQPLNNWKAKSAKSRALLLPSLRVPCRLLLENFVLFVVPSPSSKTRALMIKNLNDFSPLPSVLRVFVSFSELDNVLRTFCITSNLSELGFCFLVELAHKADLLFIHREGEKSPKRASLLPWLTSRTHTPISSL